MQGILIFLNIVNLNEQVVRASGSQIIELLKSFPLNSFPISYTTNKLYHKEA